MPKLNSPKHIQILLLLLIQFLLYFCTESYLPGLDPNTARPTVRSFSETDLRRDRFIDVVNGLFMFTGALFCVNPCLCCGSGASPGETTLVGQHVTLS